MKIKDLMIPVDEYKSVGKDMTLAEVAEVLAESGHRDVFVVNANGDLEGVLTMTDIFIALEPNYKKLSRNELSTDTLSSRYVSDLFKKYDLWSNPLAELCRKGAGITAGEAMYVPADSEFLREEDDLAQAIHHYIIGAHQPLFVRENGKITGVLRLGDIFDEVKGRMLTCAGE